MICLGVLIALNLFDHGDRRCVLVSVLFYLLQELELLQSLVAQALAEAEQFSLHGSQKGLILIQRHLAQPLLNSLLLVLRAALQLGGLSSEEV